MDLLITRDATAGILRRVAAVLCLCLALAAVPAQGGEPPAGEDDDSLILGVFPRRAAETTQKFFTPLANYLSRQLGRPVKLETTHDFVSFWDNVDKRRYDIVHYNQYHYVRSRKTRGYLVILKNEEHGRSTIASTLFVRKDSGIDSILDLKGRRIVFGGGKTAMMSYIAARHLLETGGLKEGDFISTFAINPLRAIIAIYYQQAAAAGGGDILPHLPRIQHEIDVSALKVLAKSPPMAHLPWAVKQDMAPQLRQQIQSILSSAARTMVGREALAAAQLTNLVPATDSEYDPHREIIRAVLGENY